MSFKEKQAKEAIKKLHPNLVKQIDPEWIHEFLGEHLITSNEKERIDAATTRTDKNSKLLDALQRRSNFLKVIETLIRLFEEDKEANENILKKIESEFPPYSYNSAGDLESDNQPKAAVQTTEVRVQLPSLGRFDPPELPTTNPEIPAPSLVKPHHESTDSGGRYRVTSIPRGYCIIINNTKFSTMKDRAGSSLDADALQTLFGKFLGFQVERFENLTKRDTLKLMDNTRKQDHKGLSCLVICILSHGLNGEIYGTDGNLICIKTLTGYFTGTQCPTLAGKPKIFLLQACRGGDFDHGVKIEQTDGGEEQEIIDVDQVLEEDETDGGGYQMALPDEADFLLAYATTPGYVSWRNSAFGTWFIKAFTDTMYESAHKEHMMDILTEVNRKVAEEYESRGKQKQMPAPVTMLRYKLYLPPVV